MLIARQNAKTNITRASGLVLWLAWLCATTGTGVVWVGALYLLGWDVAFYFFPFLGLLLGIGQSMLLRKFLDLQSRWIWVATSSLGWFVAVLYLFLAGFIGQIGGGLNDTDPRGSLIVASGFFGALFGFIQNPRTSLVGFYTKSWVIINASAWSLAVFVGGTVGFFVYQARPTSQPVEFSSKESMLSFAVGVLCGMFIIGTITGAGAVGFLRESQALKKNILSISGGKNG